MLQLFSSLIIETELGPLTQAQLSSINASLSSIAESLATLAFRRITSIQLNLPETEGGTMPFTYKADKPDFDFFIKLPGVDSEGNTLPDINIPTGQTLSVTSSDSAGLEISQDPLNPKHVFVHVGEPAPDETPRSVTVTALLIRDSDGSNVVTPATNDGTVTVGDAVGDPTAIVIDMPTS